MTNPHRRNRNSSPEHRKSMKDIHLGIEKSNRLKRVARLAGKINKINEKFTESTTDIAKKFRLDGGGVDASKFEKPKRFNSDTDNKIFNHHGTVNYDGLTDDRKVRSRNEFTKSVKDKGALFKLSKMKQKLAGFGRPPARVLDAFKAKKPAATKAFVSDGKKLLYNGNEVARHTKGGIAVSYAGFNSATTATTIRMLGIDTRTVKGVTTINGQKVDPHSTDFTQVPNKNIGKEAFRIKSGPVTRVTDRRLIDESEQFRKNMRIDATGRVNEVPEDPTAIQPRDQKEINSVTGVKSPIPRKTLGVDAHHILSRKDFPGLRKNRLNAIPLSKEHHKEIGRLNAKLAILKLQLGV